MDNYSNYSAYKISENILNLSYHGQLDDDIINFHFLEQEKFEEILYLTKPELAIDIPQYNIIIISIWNLTQEQYKNLNILNAIQFLYSNKDIKCLNQIQLKYFTTKEQQYLQASISINIVDSQTNTFYFIQMKEQDKIELEVNWIEHTNQQINKIQSIQSNVKKTAQQLGYQCNLNQRLTLIDELLNHKPERLYIELPLIMKLNIWNNYDESEIFENQSDNIELFLYNGFFEQSIEDNQQNLVYLNSIISQFITNNQLLSNFDIGILLNDQQTKEENLLLLLEQFIKNQLIQKENLLKLIFSIMPFQLHFEIDYQTKNVNMDINICQISDQDIQQEQSDDFLMITQQDEEDQVHQKIKDLISKITNKIRETNNSLIPVADFRSLTFMQTMLSDLLEDMQKQFEFVLNYK